MKPLTEVRRLFGFSCLLFLATEYLTVIDPLARYDDLMCLLQ
jgi:hypothetical protein